MGCLYCGKDIGPFRLLRGDEFCSPVHQKLYGDRLGKALGRMREAEPQPAGVAGFVLKMPMQDGNRRRLTAAWDLASSDHPIRLQTSCPVAIAPHLGSRTKILSSPLPGSPPEHKFDPSLEPLSRSLRMPGLAPGTLAGVERTAGRRSAANSVGIQHYDRPQKPTWQRTPSAPAPVSGATPVLRLPSLRIAAAEFETMGNRSEPPLIGKWMRVHGPAVAFCDTRPSGDYRLATGMRLALPPGLDLAIDQPQMAPSKRHKVSGAGLSIVPSRSRLETAPLPLLGPEAIAVRYPGLAVLNPAEDLLKHLRIAPPAELATIPRAAPGGVPAVGAGVRHCTDPPLARGSRRPRCRNHTDLDSCPDRPAGNGLGRHSARTPRSFDAGGHRTRDGGACSCAGRPGAAPRRTAGRRFAVGRGDGARSVRCLASS